MRVLVCGGRKYNNIKYVYNRLSRLHKNIGITCIIQGEATGADSLAKNWGEFNNIKVLKFPADWNTHGNKAGPIRNTQMLKEGKPDCVVAFKGSTGTANMIKQARAKGIPIWEPDLHRICPWKSEVYLGVFK